jgi:hypothetical protein
MKVRKLNKSHRKKLKKIEKNEIFVNFFFFINLNIFKLINIKNIKIHVEGVVILPLMRQLFIHANPPPIYICYL